MTVTVTPQEQVRDALRRLNPEFHEHDISWGALTQLEVDLRRALDLLEERLASEQVDWQEYDWIERARKRYGW